MRAILTYHSIDTTGSVISTDPATFARQVAWLASGPVDVAATVEDLLARPDGPDAVAITFDDAFANFAAAAWPVLSEHGVPATVFTPTGHVGGSNDWNEGWDAALPSLPLMDWDELGRLTEEGVTVGSHSRSHRDLRGLSDAELDDELEGAAGDLERHLGRRPTVFAYPFGYVDPRVAAAVGRTYAVGCTTRLQVLHEGTEPNLLPRLDTYYYRKPGRLEAFGSPAFRRHLWLRARARRAREVMASMGAFS